LLDVAAISSLEGARKKVPKQSYLPNFDIKNGCSQDQDFKQMEQSRKKTSSAPQIYVNQFINSINNILSSLSNNT
jgi:hypothetical protein